jgi:hypothetical protein
MVSLFKHFLILYIHLFIDGPPAKQPKKGRAGDKASASHGNTRSAKKTKTT